MLSWKPLCGSLLCSNIAPLHAGEICPPAPPRGSPVDVLVRVLDVARLTVDAVLGVDLVPHPVPVLHPLVDARRAVARRGTPIEVVLGALLQPHVLHLEVARLILLVVGVG